MTLPKFTQPAIALAVAAVLSCGAGAETTSNGFLTDVEPYIAPLSASPYKFKHIYSVGDQVPVTGDTSGKKFQFIGIPDGMGAYRTGKGKKTEIHLFVNHEISPWVFPGTVPPTENPALRTEPIIGESLVRGAFVSEIILAPDGSVKSANHAFTKTFQDDTQVGVLARADNSFPSFSRLCSASLAGPAEGFDRYIFFTNEEDDAVGAAFSPLGSQTVAIFDGEAHALSGLGHFPKENSVVQPRKDKRTVIMSMEDGPRTPDSQLYMYVGEKNKKGATALEKNGLVGGKLYALKATKAGQAKATEAVSDKAGDILEGTWVELDGAATKNAAELETEADAKGAYGFVRVEDGCFHKSNPNVFYFVTTGDSQNDENKLGRIYQLSLNRKDPLGPCQLRLILNADEAIAKNPNADVPVSPDNIDNNGRYLMINEDGTNPSRDRMTALGRDGSIWSMDLKDFSFAREGEMDTPGRDGTVVQSGARKGGIWETTGIIDASRFFARDAWFVGVQAHAPTLPPAANTAEDGQLLIMFDARF